MQFDEILTSQSKVHILRYLWLCLWITLVDKLGVRLDLMKICEYISTKFFQAYKGVYLTKPFISHLYLYF